MSDYQDPGPGRPPNSLVFAVGRLDGKVDRLLAELPAFNQRLDALEGDVVSLKEWRGQATGVVSVIVFIITAWEVIKHVRV